MKQDQIVLIRTIMKYRELNVTLVQLGVQHLDDDVLREINRNCYLKDYDKINKFIKTKRIQS